MKAVELSAKNMVIAVLALLAVTVIFFPDKVQDFMAGYSQDVDTEVNQEVTTTTTSGKQTIEIIAIASINASTLITDKLNETTDVLSPTFRYWREGATESTTATVTNGFASATLSPKEKIEWAAGTDGTIYWEKDKVTLGATDWSLDIKLYQSPSIAGVSVKVFDLAYNDLSNGTANVTAGAGEDQNLQLSVDVTDEYRAIKRPHICVDYNESMVNKVKLSGLYEVDAPTRINSALDQCFDTGLTYYIDSDTKLAYDLLVDITTGMNCNNTMGAGNYNVSTCTFNWYVVDQDLWYRDGKDYFVNPINNNDMGNTFEWFTSTYFD